MTVNSMKQLVILSGKGGTGKTCVAAAFAHLAHSGNPPLKVVLADADVDAANLDLVLQPQKLETEEFQSGSVAVIDANLCENCGECEQICRFEAISLVDTDQGPTYRVDPIACEGCAACFYHCPTQAIRMEVQLAGHWFRSQSRYGPLFHAELRPAQENSGKLVTLVKQQARLQALDSAAEAVIVDGPPGIGCPVISAASGADLAVIVTEPTASGIHDMQRVLQMAHHFQLETLVLINKADIYPEGAEEIRRFCEENHEEVIGSLPFDPNVTKAMVLGEPVTAYLPESPASLALAAAWQQLARRLKGDGRHE